MRRMLGLVVTLLALTTLAAAEPPGAGVKTIQPTPGGEAPVPEPMPVVNLAVERGVRNEPALRYKLLPDPLDLKPGNAAPLWIRAGEAASAEDRKLRDSGVKGGPPGTPFNLENKQVLLKDLPKEEVRAYLVHFALPLRLADDAARRDHCDWEMPPLTIQEMDFPLDEIQHLRMIAGLLTSRCRLELSERRSTTRSAPSRLASRWRATSIRPTRWFRTSSALPSGRSCSARSRSGWRYEARRTSSGR